VKTWYKRRPILVIEHNKQPLPVGGTTLPVADLEELLARKGLLFWRYNGLYALVLDSVVQNTAAYIRAAEQAATFSRDRIPIAAQIILWSQTLPLDSRLVQALLLEAEEPS
jgi:hypothetical protein